VRHSSHPVIPVHPVKYPLWASVEEEQEIGQDEQDQQDGRGKPRPASGLLHILLILFILSNIFSGLRLKKNKEAGQDGRD